MGDPLFEALSKEAVSVQKGTVVMKEGEVGQCAYFVVQGRLLVEKDIEGENVPIADIGPRDMVGELAILDDAPRSATVTAVEDSVLIVLNKHRIRSLIRRSPTVAEVIMKLLCHKLRSRHYSLRQSYHLDDPDIWRKATSILLICLQGEEDPGALYVSYVHYLETILDLPSPIVKEILSRLEEAGAVEMQRPRTLCVNEDKIKIFTVLCNEEYANIPIQSFSIAVEYRAAEMLLQAYPDIPEGHDSIEVSKEELLQIMAASPLWKELRPHYQFQRSERLLQHLITREIIRQSPGSTESVLLNHEKLNAVEAPQEILITYESMKSILLKA